MSFEQYAQWKSARFGSEGFALVMAFSVATRRRLFRVETPGADALRPRTRARASHGRWGYPRFLNRGGMRAVGSKRALGCSRGGFQPRALLVIGADLAGVDATGLARERDAI